MKNLERIVVELKQQIKSKTTIFLLATGLAIGYINCGEKTPEEECCDCLVDNGCTSASKSKCKKIFYGGESIPVNPDCVKNNGCYLPCAEAGAYFK